MAVDCAELGRRLLAAPGGDDGLDGDIAALFGRPKEPFTSSVEACRGLVAAALPGWSLHLGYGATGVFPYALMTRGEVRVVSDAPTVPLAILRSAVAAKACPAPSAPPPA